MKAFLVPISGMLMRPVLQDDVPKATSCWGEGSGSGPGPASLGKPIQQCQEMSASTPWLGLLPPAVVLRIILYIKLVGPQLVSASVIDEVNDSIDYTITYVNSECIAS